MALIDNALGYVPRPEEILIANGELNPLSVRALRDTVDLLAVALNGRMSLGDATVSSSRAGNLDAVYVKVVSPGANVEFPVKHELGRIPSGFEVVFRDKAGIVYASRQGSWTTRVIFLKCSAATTTLRVRLF